MERKSQSIAEKQHGTRQPTVTAQPTPDQIVVAMRVVLGRIRRMSHRDRVASLKEAGILTTSGKLAAGTSNRSDGVGSLMLTLRPPHFLSAAPLWRPRKRPPTSLNRPPHFMIPTQESSVFCAGS